MIETITTTNYINWTIPFLLGLLASFLIDFFRNGIKRSKNRTFIKTYLKSTILPALPKLDTAYRNIGERINNYSMEFLKIDSFESFNARVLNGITPVEYFDIFKDNYTVLNEIISTIEFISENLPIKTDRRYFEYLNYHLEEINKVGDIEHEKNCQSCRQHRDLINGVIEIRIEEIANLKKNILQLTK
jgi:hypothetical protein